jgi:hypothetical protein
VDVERTLRRIQMVVDSWYTAGLRNITLISNDGTLAGNSDNTLSSEKAVKTYADTTIASKMSTDGTMAGNSDAVCPTEKAVKSYVDGQVAGVAPGGVLAYDSVYQSGTTTTTSSSLGNMSGMSVSVTVSGDALVLLSFQCIHQHTTASKINTFQFFDGSDQVGATIEDKCESNNTYYPICMSAILAVSAGTTTITLRWKTTASTATAAERFLSAVAFGTA